MNKTIRLFLLTFLLIPLISFSQAPDSTSFKRYGNFFGSDCPVNTISEQLRKNDYCILYAKEYRLIRMKKGKIIWTIKFNEFERSDYICMVIRPVSSKRKKKFVTFISAYKNEEEIGRLVVNFPSGKILAKTFKEIEIK